LCHFESFLTFDHSKALTHVTHGVCLINFHYREKHEKGALENVNKGPNLITSLFQNCSSLPNFQGASH